MSKLILEFPLPEGAVTVKDLALRAELGNGCTLISSVPAWVKSVSTAVLRLEMEIEGSPDQDARPTKD